jgi:hypothetical protein
MATTNGINYNQTRGLLLSTNGKNRVIVSTGGTTTFTGDTNGSTVLSVSGTNGNLLSVVDTNTGTLLEVLDSSNNFIFQVGTVDKIKISGLTQSTDPNVLTIDSSGIVHTYPISSIGFTGGTVSGTTNFTSGVTANTLTVSAADPLKLPNVLTSTDTNVLTVDNTGIVHKIASSSLGGGGLTWNNSLSATTASTSNGYVSTATTLTTITLPTGATFGTIIEVVGTGTGLWRISQNSNQFIKFGVASTTTGTTGYLSATSQYDCVKLLCTSANTAFVVTSAIGNILYN